MLRGSAVFDSARQLSFNCFSFASGSAEVVGLLGSGFLPHNIFACSTISALHIWLDIHEKYQGQQRELKEYRKPKGGPPKQLLPTTLSHNVLLLPHQTCHYVSQPDCRLNVPVSSGLLLLETENSSFGGSVIIRSSAAILGARQARLQDTQV
ncbi:hypothetical protein V5799_027325 [Amblyomma americanum]|uniref:Uncharacterized protein n=1 Tax=Amblyomma americanum TaxID=6943 RepID=A0AAQ4DG18_AMBAM